MNLEDTQSLKKALGRCIDFQHALYEISGAPSNDEKCPSGPDNLHLTELSAILRSPVTRGFTLFSAVLNPTAFAVVDPQNETPVPKQSLSPENDADTARASAQAHWTSCKNSKLLGVLGITISWRHLQIGSKNHCKKKNSSQDSLVLHPWP